MSAQAAGGRFLPARNVLFLAMAMACAGRLVAQSARFEVLHSFRGHANGEYPEEPLTQGSDGNFYGTTAGGGRHSGGTVFKITPAGALTVLYKFTGGADGEQPDAGLTLGNDGNFYGTTYVGDTGGGGEDGTVFKITPAGVLTTLYTFTGGADGANPHAALTQGSDGNFYGTTEFGDNGSGFNGYGTVFKITPAGALTTLYTFTGGADGSGFDAGLTQGSDGNFYGTTYTGGPGNLNGTVFKITPAGVFTTLYAFTGGSNGANPEPGLTQGSDGSFYCTTAGGGNSSNGNSAGNGTVFKITPAGVLTTLYTFTGGADGGGPLAGLTQGNDGNFYGTTYVGGHQKNDGAIFKITPAGVLTTLHKFSGDDGADPLAGLTQGSDGNFYGTTSQGGEFGKGVVFRLAFEPAPPSVTLAATVPQVFVGSGNAGVFALSVPAPQNADVVVSYTIKGSAINGVDYQLIKASKKIKAGKTSKMIQIVPQGDLEGASKKVVTLVLNPGDGYTVGTTGKVKVQILSANGQ